MSKNVPEVRFEGFNEDWKQRKLVEITKVITKGTTPKDKSGKGDINFIKVENIDSISGEISITSKVSNKEHEGYLKRSQLENGDILFSIAGTLGRVTVVKKNILPANTNQALAIIRLKEGNTNFITTYLKGKAVDDYIRKNPTVGAQPNLSLQQMGNLIIDYPSNQEQTKIGSFFKQLDDTIALQQQLVEQQQQYKKAMLQKMFPQKGERVPKVRFSGFTGDWEIRKFKDFISKAGKKNSSGKDYISYSVSNKLGLIRQDEQFEGSRLDDLDKKAYKLVNPNEFAYNPARINVGSIAFNNLGNAVIVSSLYVVLKMSDKINNEYILQFIKSLNFTNEVKKNTEGSVREYLFYENFKNIKFPYTFNYKEQQRIGDFFKQLDDTIALHQKKLEDYQQLKKALLQRMFV
ncbi:restriction endonuclease subunit S [Priestia flexa]|uniref:Restriction endonuclease subunit S n=1 Tax=Priestia flexa TaxID=86664 RepID=A0ABU4J677_9BACI|nr:restriction endonuclease subunit S [Priestia flexa]MDW8516498.1 restriction endonuclease subunit S [Priestia flexa]